MSKVYRTKTGQPYILLANGRAKFIKRGSRRKRAIRHMIQHKRRFKMAKRRTRRTSRRGFAMSGIVGNIVGVGGYIAYEAYLSPKIPLSGTTKNIAEIVIGSYLSRRAGILGNVGKTAVVLNAYQLLRGFIAPMSVV